MKELIRDAIERCSGKDNMDQWLILEELYNKLELYGHHHTEIFLAIQDQLIKNIQSINKYI